MTKLDIAVVVAVKVSSEEPVFSYAPLFPAAPTSKYLNPATGDITLPSGSGSITLLFHLMTSKVIYRNDQCDVSFSLGGDTHGQDALKIWVALSDKEKASWPAQFTHPALSDANMVVATTDSNTDSESYNYRLAVGLTDSAGHNVGVLKADPRIRNNGVHSPVLIPHRTWLVLGIIVAVAIVVYAVWEFSGMSG